MKKSNAKAKRVNDHYSRLAKKESFPARSVYKLKEIQKKFNLIKRNDHILDLGCCPGSWLLYAIELAGTGGRVTGIDLQPLSIRLPKNAVVIQGDMLALTDADYAPLEGKTNVVLSDAAPSTTGIKSVDAARSHQLCEAALAIAIRVLADGGSIVCKIFTGEDFTTFNESVKQHFKTCKIFKPQSCRKASKEIYLIGSGFKNSKKILKG